MRLRTERVCLSAVNFDLLSAKETLGMLHTRGLLLSGRFKLFDYLGAAGTALLEMRQVGAAGTALPNLQ